MEEAGDATYPTELWANLSSLGHEDIAASNYGAKTRLGLCNAANC